MNLGNLSAVSKMEGEINSACKNKNRQEEFKRPVAAFITFDSQTGFDFFNMHYETKFNIFGTPINKLDIAG